jgi:hypothetical protein
MNYDVTRAAVHQESETLRDVWLFDLEKGCLHQLKPATHTNPARSLAHVVVGFLTTAAMSDYQHS